MATLDNHIARESADKGGDTELQDVEVKCKIWYKVHDCLLVLFYSLGLLSLGSLLLLSYWFPRIKMYLIGRRCRLKEATHVLIRDIGNDWNIVKIRSVLLESRDPLRVNESLEEDESARLVLEQTYLFRYFTFRQTRYVIDEKSEDARIQTAYDVGYTCEQICELADRNTTDSFSDINRIYGHNLIDVPVKSYLQLFIEEILNPFYIFQLFSIAIWILVSYYYYAGAVLLISAVSIALSLYQTRKNMVQLKNMIAFSCSVTVHRGLVIHPNTPSHAIYPGDVIEIPRTGFKVPCDCALISGNAIVNESMLTGESVPVFKTPLPCDPDQLYSVSANKRQTLFNGTQVIQTRNLPNSKVLAFVLRTGYSTSKGELVRSILFPRPTRLRFYRQSLKFLVFLIVLGAIGMLYTLIYESIKGEEPFTIFLYMSDLFTTAVPPSLPAAMTVGVIYALARLKKKEIFCISPQRINVCGKIKCACFDKTGTLTEDGLDFWGVVPAGGEPVHEPRVLGVTPLTIAMSCCHTLTLINGQLVGDSVDINMFRATGWEFEEPQEETNRFDLLVPALVRAPASVCSFEAGILHQYPFSSELQRMSVVVKSLREDQPENLVLYAKGSPEIIASLSLPESLPTDFNQVLALYTNKGLRVLAFAYKEVTVPWHKISRVPRQEMEQGLNFLGLLLMQNKLKPVTTNVIRELNTADIRSVMITGDNLLTAVNVAFGCELIRPRTEVFIISINESPLSDHTSVDIDASIVFTQQSSGSISEPVSHANPLSALPSTKYCFAISGPTFQLLHAHASRYLLTAVLLKCAVFARMSPKQKSVIIEELQKLDYVVAMCGDGANDCGALKAADVGVSLSDSEASVASHFTSKVQDIRCVPVVIKEGRTALVTSFSIFKFMALYCVIEFTSVVIMYWWLSNLGDWQYLYIDLVQVFALALVIGYTKPYPRLALRRPSANLVNSINLISCGVHMLLAIAFQVSSYILLRTTKWYVSADLTPRTNPFGEDDISIYENSVIFSFSTFQYLIIAFVFSVGPPYRMPFYTNLYFLFCFILLTIVSLVFAYLPWNDWFILAAVYRFIQIKYIYSWTFKLGLILLAGVHLLLSLLVEDFIIQTEWFRLCVHFILCKRRQKNLYKRLLSDLKKGPEIFRQAVLKLK